MPNRGRTLKFTAVIALTTLALTGFAPARGHGHSHSHSGGSGGGGCSSSSQGQDSSSSGSSSSSSSSSSGGYTSNPDDDYDDTYGSSSGSSTSSSSSGGGYTRRPTHHSTPSSSADGDGRKLKDGTVRLVSCASEKAPYATLEVSNGNDETARFWASVTFVDDAGVTITEENEKVKVPARGKVKVDVEIGGEGLAGSVDHCEVDRTALLVSG